VAEPDTVGHDPVDVTSAKLSADGRTVFLAVPNLQPVMQMEIRYSLRAADGARVEGKIYNTINRLGPPMEESGPAPKAGSE